VKEEDDVVAGAATLCVREGHRPMSATGQPDCSEQHQDCRQHALIVSRTDSRIKPCDGDQVLANNSGSGRGSKAILARAIAWLRAGDERIRSLQLRFDRGALACRRRRKLRAQLVSFLFAVPTSMDFGGMQTSTHDHDPPSGIVTA